MIKLYCAPHTISTVIVTTLNEGVHWEPILLDVRGGAQLEPEYLALNPKGRVPLLITPEGPISETGAILEYLGETALPQLVPLDPLARAKMREVMYYLASTMHVNHAHMRRGYRWADQQSSFDDMAAKVPETMAASAAFLNDLIEGPLLFGEEPTLADFYLYSVARWLEADGVDPTAYPKIMTLHKTMRARPGVAKAHADGFFGERKD